MSEVKFAYKKFVQKIVSFSPRQLAGETRTLEYLKTYLQEQDIAFALQPFTVFVPQNKKAELRLDGRKVACDANCFVSGKIDSKESILSSLMSGSVIGDPNINFNPFCKVISKGDHYDVPALCVDQKVLLQVLRAKKIQGEVEVEKVKHRSANILVGNTKNPRAIVFTHYDSINKGAIDNASGVAVTMGLILENKEHLKDVLFVIAGAEELAYDKEWYWGYGYRVFEKKYAQLMRRAETIVLVDSVGNGKAVVSHDQHLLYLGFPLRRIREWYKKTHFVMGDFDQLMTVYHSNNDDGRGLQEKYLQEAARVVTRLLGL